MRFKFQEEWIAYRRAGTQWQRWWPLVLLLLAGASRWMLVALRPETESTLASEALGCAWAALLSMLLPQRSLQAPGSFQAKQCVAYDWRGLLAGALLFAGPASALLIGGSRIDGGSVTIALALTPVSVAIATAALGTESAGGVPGRVWPGLAAVAGLLLVLAQPDLGDGRSDAVLFLAPVLMGVGAALFCADISGAGTLSGQVGACSRRSDSRRAAAALIGGSLLSCVGGATRWLIAGSRPAIALSAVACDGLLALLGILALLRLGAVRWSAQFALLPLLILLEGLVLVRPALTARTLVGLGLLTLASVYLLLPPRDDPEDGPAVVPR